MPRSSISVGNPRPAIIADLSQWSVAEAGAMFAAVVTYRLLTVRPMRWLKALLAIAGCLWCFHSKLAS